MAGVRGWLGNPRGPLDLGHLGKRGWPGGWVWGLDEMHKQQGACGDDVGILGARGSGDGAGGIGRRLDSGAGSLDRPCGEALEPCSSDAGVRGCSLSNKSLCHTKS